MNVLRFCVLFLSDQLSFREILCWDSIVKFEGLDFTCECSLHIFVICEFC
jgi:hypothetical protein